MHIQCSYAREGGLDASVHWMRIPSSRLVFRDPSQDGHADHSHDNEERQRRENLSLEGGDREGHAGRSYRPSAWVRPKNCASRGSPAMSDHGRLLDTRMKT
jgi:hypothetical protein